MAPSRNSELYAGYTTCKCLVKHTNNVRLIEIRVVNEYNFPYSVSTLKKKQLKPKNLFNAGYEVPVAQLVNINPGYSPKEMVYFFLA